MEKQVNIQINLQNFSIGKIRKFADIFRLKS